MDWKDGGKALNPSPRHHLVSWIYGTFKSTEASISEYMKKWIIRRDKGGSFVFPRLSTFWTNTRSRMFGSTKVPSSTPFIDSFSSPMVYSFGKGEGKIGVDNGGGGGGHWSFGVEETRWDCMFHNLKPT
ncbi:hypothetical protein MLD38_004939 [Melastoma candidum]|uniref:Uncharacterized protein n=1 Tax=Melastoma candidum TaxID=119954 RepID=A0ACB9SB78_9MYRT|nr:hypothetical protein MLD38_004939 [Melastoma candidum]